MAEKPSLEERAKAFFEKYRMLTINGRLHRLCVEEIKPNNGWLHSSVVVCFEPMQLAPPEPEPYGIITQGGKGKFFVTLTARMSDDDLLNEVSKLIRDMFPEQSKKNYRTWRKVNAATSGKKEDWAKVPPPIYANDIVFYTPGTAPRHVQQHAAADMLHEGTTPDEKELKEKCEQPVDMAGEAPSRWQRQLENKTGREAPTKPVRQ